MKYPQFKFVIIVVAAAVLAGCGSNRIASTQIKNAPVPPVETTTPHPQQTRELDVPYVPTPNEVVAEMLAMAEVKRDDVLYDLGSGDGRIPITAAKKLGTRGVGIDLNPTRVEEAIANARSENVADKVRFMEGDIFEADFSEATVVTLYLLPDVNLRLRPRLLEMKPGTRIVSHNYDMGNWAPEKTKKVTVDGTEHHVYFWRVPENSKDVE